MLTGERLIIACRDIHDVVVIDVEGEFIRTEIKNMSLVYLIKDLLEKGSLKFVVNLEKVKSIESFGVGEILASYIAVHNRGGSLKVACFPYELFPLRGSLRRTSLDTPPRDFFYPSVEAALESWESSDRAKKKWWQFWK